MDDVVQNSLHSEQWFSMFEKGDKRPSSIGSGALRFIRTRSSIRRDLKKHYNRNKSSGSYIGNNVENNGGGSGIGKWLRDHLGSGSKGSHDINSSLTCKTNIINLVNVSYEEKYFSRGTACTSENLYCSLPRDHGRHDYNSIRKISHENDWKSRGQDKPRSSGSNYHEKFIGVDLGGLTRGGPIYSSEGKSLKKRNRDRRRHSLNELRVHDRQRRRRYVRSEGIKNKRETYRFAREFRSTEYGRVLEDLH
ncbi:uncharacterized protein LOC122523697 [Polistes fuscatus]|uniref:uncharacterized protein LOC122523697 n=1 Tax=Polistes fuscatus TaxID=30207 RepID=UPI001CA7F889|nr:uncharacterized protein LOC122523697 [Polistes fuscatus]